MSNQGFVAIPNAVIQDKSLPGGARLLYGVILSYAWGENPCKVNPDTLAEECGISRATFFRHTALLMERGLLHVEKKRSKNGWRNLYRPVTGSVEVPDTEGLSQSETASQEENEGLSHQRYAEEHKIEEHEVERERVRAQAGDSPSLQLVTTDVEAASRTKVVKYQNRVVPEVTWRSAVALLETYNGATGGKLGAWTARGGPSATLTRIMGALLDMPDVTEEEWTTAIVNTVKCPPDWVTGKLTIGVIFGPGARESALANDGVKPEEKLTGHAATKARRAASLKKLQGAAGNAAAIGVSA